VSQLIIEKSISEVESVRSI